MLGRESLGLGFKASTDPLYYLFDCSSLLFVWGTTRQCSGVLLDQAVCVWRGGGPALWGIMQFEGPAVGGPAHWGDRLWSHT